VGAWSLDDIPWDAFDSSRVDPELIPIIKAASLVEYNAVDYRDYLTNIFSDDPRVLRAVAGWAEEETQHGIALAKWAKLADPSFDFEDSFRRFREGFRLPLQATDSVRGSRVGELVARCTVETGTSSYYRILGDATDESVLKAICRNIEADELAHYNLFYRQMERYLLNEDLGRWTRLRVALSRIAESEDDELAYAYYAANGDAGPYVRVRSSAAYLSRAVRYVRPNHFERSVDLIFRAIGLGEGSAVFRVPASRLLWLGARARAYLLTLRASLVGSSHGANSASTAS
jgi:rubrerythrin